MALLHLPIHGAWQVFCFPYTVRCCKSSPYCKNLINKRVYGGHKHHTWVIRLLSQIRKFSSLILRLRLDDASEAGILSLMNVNISKDCHSSGKSKRACHLGEQNEIVACKSMLEMLFLLVHM